MRVEILFHDQSPRAGIKLATPGSAVRLANDCAMGPVDESVDLKIDLHISKPNYILWVHLF